MRNSTLARAAITMVIITIMIAAGLSFPIQTTRSAGNTPRIRLQYASFDPLESEPYMPQSGMWQASEGVPPTYLLQFNGPVHPEWKDAVEAGGVKLYGYVPDFAFIARMDPVVANQVQSLPFIRWVGIYHPAYRVQPNLRNQAAKSPDIDLELVIQTLPDADFSQLKEQLRQLGGRISSEARNKVAGYLYLTIQAGQLDAVAGLDGVLWVERYIEMQLLNDVATNDIIQSDLISSTLGLTGAGQVIGVADTGLDTGNKETIHPDIRGRVDNTYCWGRPDPCDWSDYVTHGTHVVGSILGDGTVSNGQYAGVATGSNLIMQSMSTATGQFILPDDIGKLFHQAYTDTARIHSNSYGSAANGAYTSSSQQTDAALWELQDMLTLFSAGNTGRDSNLDGRIELDSIDAPGTAKNVLTVGATENYRPSIISYWGSSYGDPISADLMADNASGMAAFSGRGPTDDGRVKPEIAAPGTFIASLRSHQYIFDDNLEGDTSGYNPGFICDVEDCNGGTGNDPWSLSTEDAHSGSHAWVETISGGFEVGAMTFFLTPAMDIRKAGVSGSTVYFDMSFWHKSNLSTGDKSVISIFDGSDLSKIADNIPIDESLDGTTYEYVEVELSINGPPDQIRIGFAIQTDGTSDSTWTIDDIRVDGYEWSSMNAVGLASPGDEIDEAYQLNGGTSMATPLTAGAAALAREWLMTIRGVENPSAALLKALLINGAADMSPGQYSDPQEIPYEKPNYVNGWGRVDLVSSLMPPPPRQIWIRDISNGLETGNTHTFSLNVGATPITSTAQIINDATIPTHIDTLDASQAIDYHVTSLNDLPGQDDITHIVLDNITQLIVNGGFEIEGGWIVSNTARTYANTLSGDWAMVSSAAQDGWFYQTVAIPDDVITATLNYSWKNDPDDATYVTDLICRDYHTVEIRDKDTDQLITPPTPAICSLNTDWHTTKIQFSEDLLKKMRGKSINIVYRIGQDITTDDDAIFYFDDVALYVLGLDTPPQYGPLRVTLAWTDPPGQSTAGKTLVNDLDLEIIAPDGSTHYYGNQGLYSALDTYDCLRDGKWDRCNNVESTIITDAIPGIYQVIVHGYDIPGVGSGFDLQPYALVASGNNLLGTFNERIFLPIVQKQ